MFTFKNLFIITMLTVFVSSCAVYKPPIEYQFGKTQNFDKTYNEVWENIIDYMGSNNINVNGMEKQSGFIKANYKDARITGITGEIMDCGENANAESFLGEFNIVVSNQDDKVKVTVNTFYSCIRVVNPYVNPPQKVKSNCSSTGVFERHILDYIQNN